MVARMNRSSAIFMKKSLRGSNLTSILLWMKKYSVRRRLIDRQEIHRTTLMGEKWIFGSIYEKPRSAERSIG
jgi:hypothetical protein